MSLRGSVTVVFVLMLAPSVPAQVTLTPAAEEAGLIASHLADPIAFPLIQEWMTGGLAVGDFDRDGYPDVFCVGGGSAPDRLFINDGDGTFTDRAAEWGIALTHASNGASVADFDGDGLLDLYVTSMGPAGGPPAVGHNRLYRNLGGTFVDVAGDVGVDTTSAVSPSDFGSAWGDYDLDGDLDLAVASWYVDFLGNLLFRQGADGTFADVSAAATGNGLLNVWGFQPAFADMDGDLYPELLFVGDFQTSRYLVNLRDGTFAESSLRAGTGLDRNGMGQAVGDFDNNGLLDWYVTSIHFQGAPPEDHRGNMLYLQQAAHEYEESSHDASCNDGGWGWGTVAVDLDNDGWLDIVEVNGRPAVGGEWDDEPGKVFHNQQDGAFAEIGAAAGFDSPSEGRGLVVLDADRDGDMDVIVMANGGPLEYYRNDTAVGSWIQVELRTGHRPLLAPDGFGARIEVVAGGMAQVRYVNGSPSFVSTSEPVAHVGLGAARRVDEVRITWPRGQVQVLTGLAANARHVIDAPAAADLDADGDLDMEDLVALLGAWGEVVDPFDLRADLDGNGVVNTDDLLAWLGAR